MNQDFTLFSLASARTRFYPDIRKSLEEIGIQFGCRFSESMDPASAEILKSFPPVGVRISQNLSPL